MQGFARHSGKDEQKAYQVIWKKSGIGWLRERIEISNNWPSIACLAFHQLLLGLPNYGQAVGCQGQVVRKLSVIEPSGRKGENVRGDLPGRLSSFTCVDG